MTSASGARGVERPRHLVIVGPTASGKSALAMRLADRLPDVEIVSVDSMCVYRHMDIGTAKPSAADRDRVPHHLLDLVDPDDVFSVGQFQDAASAAIASIEARGRRALLVGGTGLYHRAVVDRLEIPGRWPEVAEELRPDLDDPADTAALHARLAELDPLAATRIEPTNRRRTVRALEVTIGSGRPFSSFGPGLETYPDSPFAMVGLSIERDRLTTAISARVSTMIGAGFLDEVRWLRDNFELSDTARHALGYGEAFAHVAAPGEIGDLTAAITSRTRRFAVRQERWFRRDPRIEWLAVDRDPTARVIDILGGFQGAEGYGGTTAHSVP